MGMGRGGHYSVRTRTHTRPNLRAITRAQTHTQQCGYLPPYRRYFLRMPIGLGSNCHPYLSQLYIEFFTKTQLKYI